MQMSRKHAYASQDFKMLLTVTIIPSSIPHKPTIYMPQKHLYAA